MNKKCVVKKDNCVVVVDKRSGAKYALISHRSNDGVFATPTTTTDMCEHLALISGTRGPECHYKDGTNGSVCCWDVTKICFTNNCSHCVEKTITSTPMKFRKKW